ncbi:MAG: helix-turn-helix domain-containing protein, partial [Pseudomonadota bacterium]
TPEITVARVRPASMPGEGVKPLADVEREVIVETLHRFNGHRQKTAQALGNWLSPAFSGELKLSFDADQIEALSTEREALWDRVSAADFLTREEKRAAVGYGVDDGPHEGDEDVGGGSTAVR